MKPSEFYEKYWRIDYGNGPVEPPKLSEAEKKFLNEAASNPDTTGVLFTRKRRRPVQLDLKALKEAMNGQTPKYFIPANQPKLDKWGNEE